MANAIVNNEFEVLNQTQALRWQLLDMLTDMDLSFTLPNNPSLAEMLRHQGRFERMYAKSFTTDKMDWTVQDAPLSATVEGFKQWFKSIESELEDALRSLTDDEIESKKIDRGGWKAPVRVQLHVYREAILIFCGKISVYLHAMEKPLPEQWQTWIG